MSQILFKTVISTKKIQTTRQGNGKSNFKYAKLFLKKSQFYFEEKFAENKNNPKELWKTLKSLGMSSKREMQSKTSFKENGVASFISKEDANTFCRFFLNLTDSFMQKLPRPKNKFGIKTTEEYHKQNSNDCEDFVLRNVEVTTADKIFKNLDVAKASGIDQISAKFLKDGAPVIGSSSQHKPVDKT